MSVLSNCPWFSAMISMIKSHLPNITCENIARGDFFITGCRGAFYTVIPMGESVYVVARVPVGEIIPVQVIGGTPDDAGQDIE